MERWGIYFVLGDQAWRKITEILRALFFFKIWHVGIKLDLMWLRKLNSGQREGSEWEVAVTPQEKPTMGRWGESKPRSCDLPSGSQLLLKGEQVIPQNGHSVALFTPSVPVLIFSPFKSKSPPLFASTKCLFYFQIPEELNSLSSKTKKKKERKLKKCNNVSMVLISTC